MTIFGFFKKWQARQKKCQRADKGLLIFENTSEVIQAELVLKQSGWEIMVMGPPPEIQKGCDLVIEFPLIEELNILRILKAAKALPLEVVPVTGPLLTPVDLFQVKDFGAHLMVRAANMKLTVEKNTRIIVNVSGGGCPDVPFLASRMIGKSLDNTPSPREIGHTLCGYALALALEEMKQKCLP